MLDWRVIKQDGALCLDSNVFLYSCFLRLLETHAGARGAILTNDEVEELGDADTAELMSEMVGAVKTNSVVVCNKNGETGGGLYKAQVK